MRQAADELRSELADTVTFVVNRNINVSNICTVGCAFCGFGQGRRSPDAYEHSEEEFRRRVLDAVDFGATEICMQSIHPDWTIEDYEKWLRVAKDTAPQLHLHAYSPMEIDHLAADLLLPEVFARLRAAGLGSLPGPPPRCSTTGCASASPRTSCRWRAGSRSWRRRTGPAALDRHGDVRPHRGALGAGRTHARGALATGTHRRFHRVRAALLHPVPHAARPNARDRGDLREENLKHTAAFRLALGRTVPSLQASWVKMGLDAATEALRWGVNDLGGTLMEESISRMAGSYHRGHARARRPDRRGTRRRPPGGRARHPLRDTAALRAAGGGVGEPSGRLAGRAPGPPRAGADRPRSHTLHPCLHRLHRPPADACQTDRAWPPFAAAS